MTIEARETVGDKADKTLSDAIDLSRRVMCDVHITVCGKDMLIHPYSCWAVVFDEYYNNGLEGI
jgi:hypothetical protein